MMTRQQVATRLGKSLATVRRIEGVLLHPTTDSRGVHHFDPEEVEVLARSAERGKLPLSAAVGADWSSQCPNCEALEQQVEQLRRAQATLRAERDRERAQRDAERREFERELGEFMATVESMCE